MTSLTLEDLAMQKFIKVNAVVATEDRKQSYKIELIRATDGKNPNLADIIRSVLEFDLVIRSLSEQSTNEIVPPPAEFVLRAKREDSDRATQEFLITERPMFERGLYIVVKRTDFNPLFFSMPKSSDLTDRQIDVLKQLNAYYQIDLSRLHFGLHPIRPAARCLVPSR